jgi:Flp pilus assembly protein TadD
MRGGLRLPALCAGLLVLAAGLAGCETHPPPDTTSLSELSADAAHVNIAEAEDDLASGRLLQARDKFARLVAGDQTNLRARVGLGETLLAAGDAKDAVQVLKAVPADSPYGARALQAEGLALMAAGRADAARELLLLAVKADPNAWRAWNGLGRYYDSQGQWDQAAEAYRHAEAAAPGEAIVLNNAGMSLLMQKRYAEAADTFRAALRLDPGLGAARSNLRLALAWQGQYAKAASDPSPAEAPDVFNNVGYVAMMRGDYDVAESYLLRATEASPTYNKRAWDNIRLLESLTGRHVGS